MQRIISAPHRTIVVMDLLCALRVYAVQHVRVAMKEIKETEEQDMLLRVHT